jgi:thiol-disulfide isomerase/thioredoxin
MPRLILVLLTSILFFTHIYGQAIIQGNFKSLPSTDFRIVYNQSSLNGYQGETLAKGKTNAKGEFSSSFQLAAERPVILFISNKFLRLWALPNTALTIEETSNGQYLFSGAAAKQNDFLYRSGIMIPMMVPSMITSSGFEPRKQLQYLDSIEQKRWALYKNIFEATDVSTMFASYCKGEITHFSMFYKSQYAAQNIFGQRKIKEEDIPFDYWDFWNAFEVLDDSCASDFYLHSIQDYTGYEAKKRLHLFNTFPDKEKYNQTELTIVDSLLANRPFTRERIKGEKILFVIDYFDLPQFVETQLTNYKKEFVASAFNSVMQKKWDAKKKSTLSTPGFVLKDAAGKQFDIKSLRGKVVYIDFWGSWCKACLAQMPNSLQLQETFKNKDVAFLFIDFYDTKEKWLKAVKDKKITGIHVKAEKKDETYFNEKFGIGEGFPRYALIDKNGVLVTSSAPHPNDEEAARLIEKYLR